MQAAMRRPDFAQTDTSKLAPSDLRFLIDQFPAPGRSYPEIANLIGSLPSTLESLLESRYVLERALDQRSLLLAVSPFLFFNVLLRQTIPDKRMPIDRKVINYIANLLSLFVNIDRVYRSGRQMT